MMGKINTALHYIYIFFFLSLLPTLQFQLYEVFPFSIGLSVFRFLLSMTLKTLRITVTATLEASSLLLKKSLTIVTVSFRL